MLALSLRELNRDGRRLFVARMARMFGYGFLAVVLVLYLAALGFDETRIGLLLSLTLVGDTIISLWLSTHADRYGRRRMLVLGALLIVGAGVVFLATGHFLILLAAATIGVISPSGYEVGPFLAIEQAALSQTVSSDRRTGVFAWYNLAGSFATAAGSLTGGGIARLGQTAGLTPLESYRIVLAGYALVGLVLAGLFWRLGASVEVPPASKSTPSPPISRLGLHHSTGVVFRLSGLFAMDAFAGGFVIQSILAYWFYLRFGTNEATLGMIFFGANLLAGVSALAASAIAARFGLVNTMVFTHLPSNILLLFVPLMPTLPLAISVLLLRFSISQMDVPTRQSYTMAVVRPEERSAAAGITGTARTVGAAVAPVCAGFLLGDPHLMSGLFFMAGGLKIVYDLLLLRSFSRVKIPEEGAP
ncbi:MAG TPA: MFS transporter [Candidatus Acidoferrum sp.]|nr:MFS transporter [Candidatus Acidoferrum sp.]